MSRKALYSSRARPKSGGAVKFSPRHCASITSWLTKASRACFINTAVSLPVSFSVLSIQVTDVRRRDSTDEILFNVPDVRRNGHGNQRFALPGLDRAVLGFKTKTTSAAERGAVEQS